MGSSNEPSTPNTVAAIMACLVIIGASGFGVISETPLCPDNSGSALLAGGGRDTEAVGEACFCLSLWLLVSEIDVVAGRLVVVSVVPVMRGTAGTLFCEVVWDEGRTVDEAAKIFDEVVRMVDEVLLPDDDVGRGGALVELGPRVFVDWDIELLVAVDWGIEPLGGGECSSFSSSESESSLSDSPPTVEGLLNGESGLSDPSFSFCPSVRGNVVAVPSPRRVSLGKIATGDGRRS